MPSFQLARSRLGKIWEWTLAGAFAVLCARFLLVALGGTESFLPSLLLLFGSAILAFWRSRPSLVAFAAAAPWLNGFEQTAQLTVAQPINLAFCGIFFGWKLRRLTHDAPNSYGEPRPKWIGPGINLLISAILVSLVWQTVRFPNQSPQWAMLRQHTHFGFGDPLYFQSAAFVWLQGLYFLKLLLGTVRIGSAFNSNRTGAGALKAVFWSYILSLLIFVAIQWQWLLPDKLLNFAFTSPYEDIHSFGSIAVTCLVFLLACWQIRLIFAAIVNWLVAAAVLASVIASWSRATWLAGFAMSSAILFFRSSWKCKVGLLLGAIGLLIAANVASQNPAWKNSRYLARLGSLVRFENPLQKDPARMHLYHKAVSMIIDRPLTGHGVGAFYLKSTTYARPGDPYGTEPNFAHNLFLQFASEMGLIATSFLALLIFWGLGRGGRLSKQALRPPSGDLTVFGVTMAVAAYLMTQMTANALNIYSSNQFFFWFLVAALITWPEPRANKASGSDSEAATAA